MVEIAYGAQRGLFLRRENSRCDPITRKKEFYEAFIPLDIDHRLNAGEVGMCFRITQFDCDPALPLGKDIPLSIEPNATPFSICKGPIVAVRKGP